MSGGPSKSPVMSGETTPVSSSGPRRGREEARAPEIHPLQRLREFSRVIAPWSIVSGSDGLRKELAPGGRRDAPPGRRNGVAGGRAGSGPRFTSSIIGRDAAMDRQGPDRAGGHRG